MNRRSMPASLVLFASVAFAPVPGWSEVPPIITYQGSVVDASGTPAEGPLDVECGIWDSVEDGQLLYHEQHPDSVVVDGVVNLLIGAGLNPTGEFNAGTFAGDRWLELSIGGETLSPRVPFSAVAYALQAEQAEWAASAGDVTVRSDTGEELVVVQLLANGAGFIATRGPSGNDNVRLESDAANPDLGLITVHDADGDARAQMNVAAATGAGFIGTQGPNGNDNVRLASLASSPDLGSISVHDADGAARCQMNVSASNGAGFIGTRGPNGAINVQLSAATFDADIGFVGVSNESGSSRVQMQALPAGDGYLNTRGPGGNVNAELTSNPASADLGRVTVKNEDGDVRAHMQVLSSGAGFVGTLGPNGNSNVELRATGSNPNVGVVAVNDPDGMLRATLIALEEGVGTVIVAGSNGKVNAAMSASLESTRHGQVSVFDEDGNARAGILVNGAGQGEVFADVKKFLVDYPGRPGERISYTSLEGPEVGIYCRGVAQLSGGEAMITLPAHFVALARPESLTIQLTPISFDSQGVGFEIREDGRIEVRELNGGAGSYDVHFVAHAVRKGYEDFEPVISGGRAAELGSRLQDHLARSTGAERRAE